MGGFDEAQGGEEAGAHSERVDVIGRLVQETTGWGSTGCALMAPKGRDLKVEEDKWLWRGTWEQREYTSPPDLPWTAFSLHLPETFSPAWLPGKAHDDVGVFSFRAKKAIFPHGSFLGPDPELVLTTLHRWCCCVF